MGCCIKSGHDPDKKVIPGICFVKDPVIKCGECLSQFDCIEFANLKWIKFNSDLLD